MRRIGRKVRSASTGLGRGQELMVDAVFREADAEAKDKALGKGLEQVVQPVRTAAPLVAVATPTPQAAPPKPRSTTAAVYL